MRNSFRRAISTSGGYFRTRPLLSSADAARAPPTQTIPSVITKATISSHTDRLLWGQDIEQKVSGFTSTELENLITSAGKGKSQPLPLVVYAQAINKLLTEGEVNKATDVALGRLVPQDRANLIELAANMCEDWTVAWSWVRHLQVIEKGPVLRAMLVVAKKSEKKEIVDEALSFTLTTCRRRKQLAGEVLQLYCQLVPPARWTEGQELLDMAQQSGEYFDVQAVDSLMWVMIRANQHKRVLGLWNWLKETTAGNNTSVVSAVIVALSKEHQRLSDALQLMQHLARNDEDPLPEAQIAAIELMTSSRRPNPAYANELVNFWVPVDGYTSMKLNFAVASAYAKVGGEANLAKASEVMLRVANDKAQAQAIKPTEVVHLGPSMSKSETGIIVLEKLSATIVEGCAERGSLTGLGVVLAFASLTLSDSIFDLFIKRFREIVTSANFDYKIATTVQTTSSEPKYSSLYENDEDVASAGGTKNNATTPTTPQNSSIADDVSDIQLAFEFVIRELFASLKASYFGKGKHIAARAAQALSEGATSDDGGASDVLPVSIPADTSEWFNLINSSENDDASAILDELGKD